MKAMILAAGKGIRMCSPQLPKPLQDVHGLSLIEHRIIALKNHGIDKIIINLHCHGHLISERLGDGRDYGVTIYYSFEDELMKTGGGIAKALPLLGDEPFIVVNADVWTDYPFSELTCPKHALAHLVLVDNPEHNLMGDFAINAKGFANTKSKAKHTFSGISVMRPEFFAHSPRKPFALGKWLQKHVAKGHVSAEYYNGLWVDVGTPSRLEFVRNLAEHDRILKKAVGHDIG